MIEYLEDLIPKHSHVRVIATKEEGIFLSVVEGKILVMFRRSGFDILETQFFTAEELTYIGTPGTDCPYLDDML